MSRSDYEVLGFAFVFILFVLAILVVFAAVSWVVDVIFVRKLCSITEGSAPWYTWLPLPYILSLSFLEALLSYKDRELAKKMMKYATIAVMTAYGLSMVFTFLRVMLGMMNKNHGGLVNIALIMVLLVNLLLSCILIVGMLACTIYTFVKTIDTVQDSTASIIGLVLCYIFLPVCKLAAISSIYRNAIIKKQSGG